MIPPTMAPMKPAAQIPMSSHKKGIPQIHRPLMDDDVIVDPEVFKRVYSFQRFINNETLCLGGSMLNLDTRYIQHENMHHASSSFHDAGRIHRADARSRTKHRCSKVPENPPRKARALHGNPVTMQQGSRVPREHEDPRASHRIR